MPAAIHLSSPLMRPGFQGGIAAEYARAYAARADAYILLVPYAGASREATWPKAGAHT